MKLIGKIKYADHTELVYDNPPTITKPQPPEPYSPCPCGSGKKYKFCCKE